MRLAEEPRVPDMERKTKGTEGKEMNSTNTIVQNALKAKACNTSQLELSLRYAGRLQSELRDVARSGNGRMTSSNTVEFPTEDDAEDAMEYLIRYAHVPKGEIWINSKINNSAVATNAVATNYNPFFVGDVVTYDNTPGKRFKVRRCGTDWCKVNEIDGSGNYVKGKYGLDYDAFVVSVGQIHKVKNSANAVVVKSARTDWNQEIYNITEKVKKLVAKAKAEGATGPNSFGEIFENCLKVLRGY